ncbi:hypothetical protein M426DRAFT_317451 [Hypoxylon sp. CI-4A]|nr:hypothetical protein M426DRAFT_317451 [Hypoxylon sp. CI-4A]
MAETKEGVCNHDALRKQIEDLTSRLAQLEAKCSTTAKPPTISSSVQTRQENNETPKPEEKTYESWQIRLITNRRDPDSKTGERKDFEESQVPGPEQNDRHGAAAILKLFVYDSKDNSNDERESYGELEILNEHLRDLLRKLLTHHPSHELHGESAKLQSPYEPLIMNWDLLTLESKKEPVGEEDRIARRGLCQLLDLLQQTTGDTQLNDYLQNRESLTKSKNITFDALWTIFPPGTIIYGRPYLKNDQVFIVEDLFDLWPEPADKWWSLTCWTYDWNGQVFRRKPLTLRFPRFRGTKAISALPYYPLSEAKDEDKIRESLIARGKAYRKYCTTKDDGRRFRYDGIAVADKTGFRVRKAPIPLRDPYSAMRRAILSQDSDDEDMEAGPKELTVKGEVMIDFESYYQYGPQQGRIGDILIGNESDECTCPQCSNNVALAETYHRNFDEDKGTEEWVSLQYMLCPPRILGYILREKQWAQLQINSVKPIKDDDSAFRSGLHLKADSSLQGEEIKELLLSLVKTHGQGQVADLVEEKGKGLVILLYGDPGVGKTSTAETLAAAAGKTLFSIGVGDVGIKAKNVEANLRRIFDLATRWKAVLLIDEVDVFVQSRGMGHQGPTTERNALVSVFLRVLEYYQGIVILTTNQIALFDIAVQSRIHIAIKFTKLDRTQSKSIFQQRVDKYNKKGLVEEYTQIMKYGEDEIHKKGFDGRQLRNLVASAMGRAQAREEGNNRLKMIDIDTIVSNMTPFKGDLEYQMRRYQDFQNQYR